MKNEGGNNQNKNMNSTNIIFKDIVKRWELATSTSLKKVIAFSPYITSPIAEKALQCDSMSSCDLYTQFNAEIFINRSSSLSALRKLLISGYEIYYLQNLHAKIVLVDDDFVSIGSQNITRNGTINKESNVILTDINSIGEIKFEIENWISERKKITSEMIDEMEELIEPHLKAYELMLEEIAGPEKKLFLHQEERDKVSERLALKEKIDRLLKSTKTISTRINEIEKYSETTDAYYTTYSLMPINKSENLTKWEIGGKVYSLKKSFRYICLNLMTGNFGWARVFKTRITFFENSVNWEDSISLNGSKCDIAFTALQNNDKNIEVKVTPQHFSSSSIVLQGKFDWNCLRDIQVLQQKSNLPELVPSVFDWIENNLNDFADTISVKLLKPFKYKHNLTGNNAHKFFENWSGVINLKLVEVKGFKILVADKI